MTLGEYLAKFLPEDEALAELVGDRVYDRALPQPPEYPAIVFEQTGGDMDETLEGKTDFRSRRVEFTCYAKDDIEAAENVSRALMAFLAAHHGAAAGFEFDAASLLDGADEKGYDDELEVFFAFQVWIVATGGDEG